MKSIHKIFAAGILVTIIGFGAVMTLSAEKAALPGVPQKEKSEPAAQKKPSTMPEGQMENVDVIGGQKTGVSSEKPILEIEMNQDEPVQTILEPEDELLRRQPESLRNPRAGFAESLGNSRTVIPGRIRLAKDPVRVFYPLRDIMAISPALSQEIGTGWEMVVTDTEGRPFRKFSGRGIPPTTVPWNGRSDRGEFATVGKTYSTVVTYKDTRGQQRNLVGEPFSFDGIIHQESKGLIISLALSSLFEPKKGFAETETIGESGLDLLQESTDWIKRYYFTYPVRVECYSPDANLAVSRAQAASKVIGSLLLLPRGEIAANGTTSDAVSGRIDILIANR